MHATRLPVSSAARDTDGTSRVRPYHLASERRRLLRIDLVVAVLAAAGTLALAPGLAVAGVFAAVVLVVCVASGFAGRRRARSR